MGDYQELTVPGLVQEEEKKKQPQPEQPRSFTDRMRDSERGDNSFAQGVRQRNLERNQDAVKQGYRLPVRDWEMDLINTVVAKTAEEGGDPDEAKYQMATAMQYSRMFDIPLENAVKNLDVYEKYWLGTAGQPTKTHWKALTDSLKIGMLSVDLNELGKQLKYGEGGDRDAPGERQIWQQIQDIEQQIGSLQDNVPRPFLAEIAKSGLQSAPFTLRAAKAQIEGTLMGASGAAAVAGLAGVTIGTGGLGTIPLATILATGAVFGRIRGLQQSSSDVEGLEYLRMRENGIDHDLASSGSSYTSTLIGLVEQSLGAVPGLVGAIGGPAVVKTVTQSIARQLATKNVVGRVLKGLVGLAGTPLEEAVEEGVQQIISNSGDIIVQNLQEQGVGEKEAIPFTKDVLANMKEGAKAGLFLGIGGNVIAGYRNVQEARGVANMAQRLEQDDFTRLAKKADLDLLENVDEESQDEVLKKIWEAQQRRKKGAEENAELSEEEVAQAEASEQPQEKSSPLDVKRLENNRLYATDKMTDEISPGITEGMLKVGDPTPGSGKRYGYISYREDSESVTIEEIRTGPGYENIRRDMIIELAANKPGKDIVWEPQAARLQELRDEIIGENPRGPEAGLQWFDTDTEVGDLITKQDIRRKISEISPGITKEEQDTHIAMIQAIADVRGVGFEEFVNQVYAPGVYTSDPSVVSAAQGKRGGVSFKKVEGQTKALVYLTEHSDFSTLSHEFIHAMEPHLSKSDQDIIREVYGKDREGLAEDFEVYLHEGKAPTPELKTLFQRIAHWMRKVYQTLSGKDIDPRIRQVFDDLFTKPESPLSHDPGNRPEGLELYQADNINIQERIREIRELSPEEITPEIEDELIEMQFLNPDGTEKPTAAELGEKPKVLFTGGVAGSGKSKLIPSDARERGVEINPDIFKEITDNTDPAWHETASRLAKETLKRAQERGHHVLYDSQLTNYALAESMVERVLAEGGVAEIRFVYIDAETSLARTKLRYLSAKEKGEPARPIPDSVIVKGYNFSLPTFLALHDKYSENQNVRFFLYDNNVDLSDWTPVIERNEIKDQVLFDKLSQTDYILSGEGNERKYQRKERLSEADLQNLLESADRRVVRVSNALRGQVLRPDKGRAQEADADLRGTRENERRGSSLEPPPQTELSQEPDETLFQPAPPPESDAFKAWFGDSKVVDDKGDPLVVYHTTDAKISVFRTAGEIETAAGPVENRGSYFSPNPEAYAHKGRRAYPVYLSLKNPYETTGQLETAVITPERFAQLRSEGYDGAILRDSDGAIVEAIAFEPAQIKSVFNKGTFDPENPNILFQRTKPADFSDDQKAAIDKYLATRPDGDEIKGKLELFGDTPFGAQLGTAMLVRAAATDLIEGKYPDYENLVTQARKNGTEYGKKLIDNINEYGAEGILHWVRSRDQKWFGHPKKPGIGLNGSFLSCDPSEACAKFCYASKGNYIYPEPAITQEMISMAVEMFPKEAAQDIVAKYQAEYPDSWDKRYLRIFDRGDGNDAWVGLIKELNAEGVHAHVFTKKPEFAKQIDQEQNVVLLSIDNTNVQKAKDNPDLRIAFVYTGPEDIEILMDLEPQVQMVLPVVGNGGKIMAEEKIAPLRKTFAGRLCPIDAGMREMSKGTCALCSKGKGVGCYYKRGEALMTATKKSVDEITKKIETLLGGLDEKDRQIVLRKLAENEPRRALPAEQRDQDSDRADENREGTSHSRPPEGYLTQDPLTHDEILYQTAAWHGSPHRFERFSTEYMGSGEEASLFLLRAGIDGIRYPTGTLTGGRPGGYNYVVFDDREITVEEHVLFQEDKKYYEEARNFDSWQEWQDYVEAMTPEEEMTLEELERDSQWYKEIWQKANDPTIEGDEGDRYLDLAELDRRFIERMADKDELNNFLWAMGDIMMSRFDTPQNEYDAAQMEENAALANRLNLEAHPTILNNAVRVLNGNDLTTRARKSILTLMKQAPRDYRAIFAAVTGEDVYKVTDEELASAWPEIEDPKIPRRQLSISERVALSRKIKNDTLAAKVRSGEVVVDEDIEGLIASLDTEIKGLQGQIQQQQDEIARGDRVISYNERKMSDLADELEGAERELKAAEKEIANLKERNRKVSDRLKATRDQRDARIRELKQQYGKKLEVAKTLERFLAKKKIRDMKDELREKQQERRNAEKVRAYKQKLAKRIMRPPSKNIHWDEALKILDIQATIDPNFRQETARDKELLEKVRRYMKDTPEVLDEVDDRIRGLATGKNLSSMTIEELERTAAFIDSLARHGRVKLDLARLKRARAAENSRYAIEDQIAKSGRYSEPPPAESEEAKKGRHGVRSILRSFDYGFMNMARKAMRLDGDKEGENYRLLVLEERRHRREKLKQINRRTKPIVKAMKDLGISIKDLYKTHKVLGVGPNGSDGTFTTSDLMYVLAAADNPDSYQAVAFGNLMSATEKQELDENMVLRMGRDRMEKLLQEAHYILGPSELRIVELIKKDFDANFDRLNETAIQEFNEGIVRVGSYVPIKRKDLTYEDLPAAIRDDLLNTNAGGTKRLPKRGMIKERMVINPEHQKPTQLDLFGTWRDSVETQEHFIEYTGYVRELNAVYKSGIHSGTTRAMITGAFGPEMLNDIDDQITEYTNPSAFIQRDQTSRALRALRGDLGAAYLSWKMSGVVTQIVTSPWPYLAYVNPIEMASAFTKVMMHPLKSWQEVSEKSVIMKERSIDPVFEAIKQGQKDAPGRRLSKVKSAGMKGIEWADRVSVMAGWLAVYGKTLAETNGDEQAAIEKADDVTLKTQPTGQAADLSPAFKTKQEAWRVFLQFQSPLNVIWQNIRYDLPTAIKNEQFARAVGIITSYIMAGVMYGLAKKGFDDDDDQTEKSLKLLFYATTQFSDAVPLLGSSATTVMERVITGEKAPFFQSSLYPAAGELFSSMSKITNKQYAAAAKDFAESMGYFLGAPVSGAKEAVRAGKEIAEGDFGGMLGSLAGRRDY